MYYPEFEQGKNIAPMMEPDSEKESKKIANWDHPFNVRVGEATLIYIPPRGYNNGGWALPGGRFTSDKITAHEVAGRMNWLMGGSSESEFAIVHKAAMKRFEREGWDG